MQQDLNATIRAPLAGVPRWVPAPAVAYLAHTEAGRSIRSIAREVRCHASTILRQVRRLEGLREDPLIDAALSDLGRALRDGTDISAKESTPMTEDSDDDALFEDCADVLARLAEPGTVLAVGRDLAMAAVVSLDGRPSQTMQSVARDKVQAMALKGWIAQAGASDRLVRYTITAAGQAMLRRALPAAGGFREAAHDFAAAGGLQARSPGESPLQLLARRKDKSGRPFLGRDLVVAAERLREDFEIAQLGGRIGTDWSRLLEGRVDGGAPHSPGRASEARLRFEAAMDDLGPGLSDVVLRCCCHEEGMESAERRMGWSARSGKIVLRIALQRLVRHYERTQGSLGPMIG